MLVRWNVAVRTALLIVILAVSYVVLGRLAFAVSVQHGTVTSVVFVPEGLALAFVILFGRRVAPGILLGEILLSVWAGPSVLAGALIGTVNMLESVLGAYLFERWALRRSLDHPRDVARFVVLVCCILAPISATGGVSALLITGGIPADLIPETWAWWVQGAQPASLTSLSEVSTAWLHWWIANIMGQLLVAPVLLVWSVRQPAERRRLRPYEIAVCVAGIAAVTVGAVGRTSVPPLVLLAVTYPLLVWVGMRGGTRPAVMANLLLAPPVIWAGSGEGFLADASVPDRIAYVSFFIASGSLVALVVAAVLSERRELIDKLTVLASRDPLAPVANRRHFLEVFRSAADRSWRTGDPASVLVVDIDDFKVINDRFGHAVGDAVIVMVGRHCAAIAGGSERAGRLGGEEFALILVDTGIDDAAHMAERLRGLIAADHVEAAQGRASVTVSIGVAELIPGHRVEQALDMADAALYAAKSAGRDQVRIAGLTAGPQLDSM
ncbi:sensor domain-containing diguanylate cyclase [Mycolicibacterium vinylchloridicum]|uniref:sensor domain-containing diguanylate cyclase n=1 Tax=Mycolicibacterium vinylchloridicum TaxID=2736928 RepID=UPI0015CED1ED|nr:diguanylate cyclase [Mycolicibacterium vinylchloridicum]